VVGRVKLEEAERRCWGLVGLGRGGVGLGTIPLIGTNTWVMQQRDNFSIGADDVRAILLP
jgi:hypothetical protein